MNDEELKKIELHIERLKSAILTTQRRAKIMEEDLSDRIDYLLELLSEAIQKRDELKK